MAGDASARFMDGERDHLDLARIRSGLSREAGDQPAHFAELTGLRGNAGSQSWISILLHQTPSTHLADSSRRRSGENKTAGAATRWAETPSLRPISCVVLGSGLPLRAGRFTKNPPCGQQRGWRRAGNRSRVHRRACGRSQASRRARSRLRQRSRRSVGTCLESGRSVVLDVRSAEFIDSSIIHQIFRARADATARSLGFSLCLSSDSIARRALELTGALDEIPHADTITGAEALADPD